MTTAQKVALYEGYILKLEAALASGSGTVQFGGRLQVYRSTEAIKDAIAYFNDKIARLNGRSRQALGYAVKGF